MSEMPHICNFNCDHGDPTSTGGTGQEEKYEFVTKDELSLLIAILSHPGHTMKLEYVKRLIAERDAFREVALQQSLGRLVGPDEIDAEAKRLLSEVKP